MSETLYQRMNPVAVLFGSSMGSPLTSSTCWENKWIPQPYFDDSLSICSMMQRSVPWRRSRNGETTTICKQAPVCLSFISPNHLPYNRWIIRGGIGIVAKRGPKKKEG